MVVPNVQYGFPEGETTYNDGKKCTLQLDLLMRAPGEEDSKESEGYLDKVEPTLYNVEGILVVSVEGVEFDVELVWLIDVFVLTSFERVWSE